MPQTKVGRNDPCPCGSGEKYKRCCGLKAPTSQMNRIVLVLVAGAVVGAIVMAIASFRSDGGGPQQIWDPVHGHYHTVP